MENEEKRIKEEVLDTSVFKYQYHISNSLVTKEEFDVWNSSKITKGLLDWLEYLCMTVGTNYNEDGSVDLYLMGEFDIKKGILSRKEDVRVISRYKI
jgi:hypothetical protein